MSIRRQQTAGKRGERGYALLVVIFLGTLLLLSTMVVAPNILTEGRREKEKDMIWRGKQYTRGIKLYYRKMGRFPTSLDDLTKPKVGSIRFMRQAYKDPMNREDGSWRLIYVGPAGQLIGSLKPHPNNLQLPQAGGAQTSAVKASGSPGQPGALGQATGTGQINTSGQPSQGGTQPGTNPPSTTGNPVSADQGDAPISSGTTPTIVGGNIIGVGSKINKSSIILYDQAKNYRLFEFIWDPSKDTFGVGQPGLQTGTGLGQPIGQPPGQNPTTPPQNPQPQQ